LNNLNKQVVFNIKANLTTKQLATKQHSRLAIRKRQCTQRLHSHSMMLNADKLRLNNKSALKNCHGNRPSLRPAAMVPLAQSLPFSQHIVSCHTQNVCSV